MKSLCIVTLIFFVPLVLLASSAQQPSQSPPITPSQQPATSAAAPTPPFAEQIRKTVAFLMVAYRNGPSQGGVIGTCFFVWLLDTRLGENQGFVYLVTNRHVSQPGADVGTPYQVEALFIRMNLVAPAGGAQSVQQQIPLTDQIHWFFPSDEAVDLAILPVAPDSRTYDYVPVPSNMIVNSEQFKTGDVGVGDPVSFAGYFSNFPVRTAWNLSSGRASSQCYLRRNWTLRCTSKDGSSSRTSMHFTAIVGRRSSSTSGACIADQCSLVIDPCS